MPVKKKARRRSIPYSTVHVFAAIIIFSILVVLFVSRRTQTPPSTDQTVDAASPSCTHTYATTGFNAATIPAGAVICVNAGQTYKSISLAGLRGTKDKPISIVNRGGQVKISGGTNAGIDLNNSQFFRFMGTGDPTIPYGFLVKGSYNFGARIDDGSTDFEFDHVEISGNSSAKGAMIGLSTKTKAEENRKCTRFARLNPPFVQRNTVIHDVFIHTVPGEAMYIGNNYTIKAGAGQGQSTACGFHPIISGLKVYNNRIADVGREGLNVKGTPENCLIYGNTVERDSRRKIKEQSGGISAAINTRCDISGNTVRNGWGPGIQDNGTGGNKISQNTVINAGKGGIPGFGYGIQIKSEPDLTQTSVIITGNTVTKSATKDIEPGKRGLIQ